MWRSRSTSGSSIGLICFCNVPLTDRFSQVLGPSCRLKSTSAVGETVQENKKYVLQSFFWSLSHASFSGSGFNFFIFWSRDEASLINCSEVYLKKKKSGFFQQQMLCVQTHLTPAKTHNTALQKSKYGQMDLTACPIHLIIPVFKPFLQSSFKPICCF